MTGPLVVSNRIRVFLPLFCLLPSIVRDRIGIIAKNSRVESGPDLHQIGSRVLRREIRVADATRVVPAVSAGTRGKPCTTRSPSRAPPHLLRPSTSRPRE